MRIAFLGTGLMGAPMVRNCARAGFELCIWNRSVDKARALVAEGISMAETAAEAVAGADVVISMLTDGAAVQAVAEGVRCEPDTLWIDMSSTRPEDARAMAARGHRFLDAPVSGGVKGAEEATLAIMVGGTQTDFDRAVPVLSAMGRPTRVGPVGSGQLAKLANQAIVGITIAAVAEANLLLEQGGADVAAVRAALRGGFADSTILQQHGRRMQDRDFAPGGPSEIQLKDMNNVLAEAGTLELPVTAHVRDRYARLVDELGRGREDHAALFAELLDRNGLG